MELTGDGSAHGALGYWRLHASNPPHPPPAPALTVTRGYGTARDGEHQHGHAHDSAY